MLERKHILHFGNRNDAVEQPGTILASSGPAVIGLLGLKFTGNSLQYVTRRHQAEHFAVFIHDKRERHVGFTEMLQKLHPGKRLWHIRNRHQIVGEVRFARIQNLLQKHFGGADALHIVQTANADRQPRSL